MTEVLSAPGNGASHFESGSLHRSSSLSSLSLNTSNPYIHSCRHSDHGTETSAPSSAPSSPRPEHPTFSRAASYASTPASSLSLDIRQDSEEDCDQEIKFPSFEVQGQERAEPASVQSTHMRDEPKSSIVVAEQASRPQEPLRTHSSELPWDLLRRVQDDYSVEEQPTRHVDYLSHEWREEDIWASWRHIVSRRSAYSNGPRLENASWRTWTKAKNNLRTISPENLNWLKDCDVTWLYGPLQTGSRKSLTGSISPPPSRLSTCSSFLDKKPILKKKSASQTLLQRSISSHSLLKQAGAMLQAQQAGASKGRPSYERSTPEFTVSTSSHDSVANTPACESFSSLSTRDSVTSSGFESPSERRHIHFNNEVEQCIAVESKDFDERESIDSAGMEDSDSDDLVMMAPAPSRSPNSGRTTPRTSFSAESKTIKPLPSTTLKYRSDTPEPKDPQPPQPGFINRFWSSNKTLSPSPSQETLRPTRNQVNFLLDDDDEDPDVTWTPDLSNSSQPPGPTVAGSSMITIPPAVPENSDVLETYTPAGLRRTESGMFMPFDEDEDEAALNNSLIGRVVDTVNTARDIAHVIWNVGWRR